MKKDLLVVTSTANFGELIQHSISDTGSYRVHLAKGKADAILAAEKENCTLALMDMELGEKVVLEIGRSLRTMNPDLDLVILDDEELPPAMDDIRPWVLLRKPFYLPDFIELIRAVPIGPDSILDELDDKQSSESKSENVATEIEEKDSIQIPWLNNVSKAAQHLTRLTLESSAQAALITREKKLWAYAGQLSQDAANELAGTVSRHWDWENDNDLLRFVRLASTKAEHMLYATSMTKGVILAMVFDAETPFSTIRNQANNLADSLAIAKTGSVQAAERTPLTKGDQARVESEADEFDEDFDIPSIAEILDSIPPSVPSKREEVNVPEMSTDVVKNFASDLDLDPSIATTRPSTPLTRKPDRHSSNENSPAIPIREFIVAEQPLDGQDPFTEISEDLEATVPSAAQRRQSGTSVQKPGPGELDETIPQSMAKRAGRLKPEPATPAMAQLTFACLLVPRFTAHYMTGDIADRLSQWMPDICIAFGWRLEFLAIRPEYLQWVVNVLPNTSPGNLMRIMREQTSEKIFTDIPRLRHENPSGDFWAPGYLIMGGIQPHPPQLVKDYIKQTRRRQGISQTRR